MSPSGLLRQMPRLGHPSAYRASVLGLHDAEQSLADVFRKAAFVAHKHASSVPEPADGWRAGRAISLDFSVALLGRARGLLSETPGPDLQTAVVADVSVLGVGGRFGELPAMTESEVAVLIAASSTVTSVDRWVTYPAPRGLFARAKERRRLGESILRDRVRRGLQSALRRLGK